MSSNDTLSKMHKDLEKMEALSQSAVRDGGLRQIFTDQVMQGFIQRG